MARDATHLVGDRRVEAALEDLVSWVERGTGRLGLTERAKQALKDAYRPEFATRIRARPRAWQENRLWVLPFAGLIGSDAAFRARREALPRRPGKVNVAQALAAARWVAREACRESGEWCRNPATRPGERPRRAKR